MKTAVTNTSIITYHSEIKGDKENSQAKIVYLALLQMGKPASMRMIQKHLKERGHDLEVNVMSRSMTTLKEGNGDLKIYWVLDSNCEVTGRHVGFFDTVNPGIINKDGQSTLFQ